MLAKPVEFWLSLTTICLLIFPILVSSITPPPQNKRRQPRPPRYNYINQCRQNQQPGPLPPNPPPPPPPPPPPSQEQPQNQPPPGTQNNPNYYKWKSQPGNGNTKRKVRRNGDGTIDFKTYSKTSGRLIKSCKVYPNDLENYAFTPVYGFGSQRFNPRDIPLPEEEEEDKYWDEDGFFNQPFWNWYDEENFASSGYYSEYVPYNDPYDSRGEFQYKSYKNQGYCGGPGQAACGDSNYYQTPNAPQGYRKVCKFDDKSIESWYTYEGKLLKEKIIFDKDGQIIEKWIYDNGGYFIATTKPSEIYIEEEYNGDTQIKKRVEYLNNGFKVQTDYFPDGSKRRYRFNDDDELTSGYFEDKFGNVFEEEGWI